MNVVARFIIGLMGIVIGATIGLALGFFLPIGIGMLNQWQHPGDPTQGNCMLNRGKSGPNLFEDVLVPAGAESFAADVVFDRSVAL